jgi:hypothetical protein
MVACKGNVDALNEALAQFTLLPAVAKEIWLFPAPGLVRTINDKTTLPCDWRIQGTSHIQFMPAEKAWHSAVATIYIGRCGPIPAPDARAVDWITDLNDDQFRVRQRAFQSLADLGDAAVPVLRQALAGNPTREQQARIVRLLGRLQEIHLARVHLPAGVTIYSIDELLEREVKNWRIVDLGKSWQAAEKVSDWAEYSETTLPVLVEMLQDSREQVRDLGLKSLTRLGKRAAGILPALQTAERRSASTRGHLQRASQAIGQAPVEGQDPWLANRRLRKGIAEFCRSFNQRKSAFAK